MITKPTAGALERREAMAPSQDDYDGPEAYWEAVKAYAATPDGQVLDELKRRQYAWDNKATLRQRWGRKPCRHEYCLEAYEREGIKRCPLIQRRHGEPLPNCEPANASAQIKADAKAVLPLDREMDVMRWMSSGWPVDGMADCLGLSERSVRRIMAKLEAEGLG